ncbi:Uncharacterised protein [Mycobacteroides abscessus subsp. abscessus]|nr:Uncharacterised protein [Mycobacteroides abscessus subsp. abscessus]
MRDVVAKGVFLRVAVVAIVIIKVIGNTASVVVNISIIMRVIIIRSPRITHRLSLFSETKVSHRLMQGTWCHFYSRLRCIT